MARPRAATAIPPRLCVAPLQVWGPMRDKLLADKTVVFTSRDADARRRLRRGRHLGRAQAGRAGRCDGEAASTAAGRRTSLPWRGLDVGSPFDYGQQAILYVARHLPPPGRDGLGEAQLDEIVELVDAAEGRTLGLFSLTPGRRGRGRGGPRRGCRT